MSKAKNYQLTLNEVEHWEGLLEYLKSLNPSYLVAAKEKAPTTGHEHIHCYVQFPTSRALSLKKTLGAHIEKCKGNPQQNQAYVKKDGDIIEEIGKLRRAGATIQEIKKMEKDERELLPLCYFNIVNKVNSEEDKKLTPQNYYKGPIEVNWYWGESGAGKTRQALKEIGEAQFNEVKFDGNFWHGVQENCEIALYDDWRDNHMKPVELINFIDYNRHVMNVKGGTVRNNYKKIFITSLQNPEEIYKNTPEETKKQWMRRIKTITLLELLPNAGA